MIIITMEPVQAAIATASIRQLSTHQNERVKVRGWAQRVHKLRNNTFVDLRDGPAGVNHVQLVVRGLGDLAITQESYIEVIGTVKPLPEGKRSYQTVEIQVDDVKILGGSESDFSNKCPDGAGSEVRLDERHIYLRDPTFAVYTKLRAMFLQALRAQFASMGCTEIIPPCFVSNQCEGGATLFKVAYPPRYDGDDIDAYLTQSSQFYLEMAVPAVGDCYCIYPSFRKERSHTRRHLTEFLHAEAEWRDVTTLQQHNEKLVTLLRGTIYHFLNLNTASGLNLLEQIGRRDEIFKLASMDVVTMTHAEAIQYCRENEIYADEDTKTHFGPRDDIPEAQERRMIDKIGKIVLLCKFPREFKSFYMATDPTDSSYVLGCDVEVPGVGEVIGSGVRVSDYAELLSRLREQKLRPEEYREYLDLRKYGHSRTSGMGLGVDRFLTWLLGLNSIRDIVTFPRVPGRLAP